MLWMRQVFFYGKTNAGERGTTPHKVPPRPHAPPLSNALTSQALRGLFLHAAAGEALLLERRWRPKRVYRLSVCHMRLRRGFSNTFDRASSPAVRLRWTATPTSVTDVVAPAGGSWTKTPSPASLCAAANWTKPRAVPLPNGGAVSKACGANRSVTETQGICLSVTDRTEPSFIFLLIYLCYRTIKKNNRQTHFQL